MNEVIDIGTGELRHIGSGVRPAIDLAEMLKDEYCCVFVNLKAKKLGPIAASHGMVMCANHEGKIELVRPPKGSKLGERIGLEGNPIGDIFSQDFQEELKPKKKIME
jgi:Putative tRNA binding domain.